MLGCILRSPSPSINISDDETAESIVKPESNPSTTNSSINQSHVSVTSGAGSADQMLRQIQVLTVGHIPFLQPLRSLTYPQARITDLERANIKPEAATTGTLVKSEGVGVKREREEDEGQQDSRQRRRTAVKIEHIDLTDD